MSVCIDTFINLGHRSKVLEDMVDLDFPRRANSPAIQNYVFKPQTI